MPAGKDHFGAACHLSQKKSVALKGFFSSIFLFRRWRTRKVRLSVSWPLMCRFR